jgi:DNA-binding XRE family transcriptional regulator
MTSEYTKAREWREAHNLSPEELGKLIGYSVSAIYWFEAGRTPPRTFKNANRKNRSIDPTVWLRYKAACAGIDTEGQPIAAHTSGMKI